MPVVDSVCNSECTGCGVCVSACKYKAIDMRVNDTGFRYPNIDKSLCTSCGACARACPEIVQGQHRWTNFARPDNYCGYYICKEISNSTSGGAFYAFAKEMIRRGGFVAGCVMKEDLSAEFILAQSMDEVARIQGSKYIQSSDNRIYEKIEEKLMTGYQVLFAACPCQIAALYSYLKCKYDGLITTDLICHGVGSDRIYQRYIHEMTEKYGNIKTIRFRDKDKRYASQFTITLTLENGRRVRIPAKKDRFFRLYLNRMIYRDSCYQCRYAALPRVGDFTIGDYIELPKGVVSADVFDKGVSMVFVNNKKAEAFLRTVKSNFETIKRPLDEVLRLKSNIIAPSVRPKEQKAIVESDLSLSVICRQYMPVTLKMRIAAILGNSLTMKIQRLTKKR